MIPDAEEQLSELVPDYPLTNALVGFGIFMVLTIEQSILVWHSKTCSVHQCNCAPKESSSSEKQLELVDMTDDNDHDHDHDHGHDHVHSERCDHREHHRHVRCCPDEDQGDCKMHESHEFLDDHDHGHDHQTHYCHYHQHEEREDCKMHDHFDVTQHEHNHSTLPLDDLMAAESLKDLVSAYALEISTAIHSVIIGFDLGVLTDLRSASVLCAVLAFHQFVEGLGLGSVVKNSQKALGTWKIISFILVFSGTVSVGVLLGLLIKPSGESPVQQGVVGSATAVAAGSLLHISLVEMTSEYFNLPELERRGPVKMAMLGLFFLGFGFMAMLGVWA